MLLHRPCIRASASGGERQASRSAPVSRRTALRSALLAAGAALTLATPSPAFARNAEAAAQAAAARKAALKAAIDQAKATGRDAGEPEAFQSASSVPEDHSPNSHSHQDEGARTTGGG